MAGYRTCRGAHFNLRTIQEVTPQVAVAEDMIERIGLRESQ